MASALLGVAMLLGMPEAPTLAAGPGKLAGPVPASSLHLVGGYKHCDHHGCYYCQRRECDDYYYSYGKKYCKHYSYYDCSPYGRRWRRRILDSRPCREGQRAASVARFRVRLNLADSSH